MTRSFALLLLAAAPAAAEPCKPYAQLEGDAAAVASVTVELVKLGVVVDAAAPAGCKTVLAAVELGSAGGLAIAVKTGMQSEGRTVSDAVVAASWIDSWVADDFAPPQPAANGFFDLRPAAPSHAPGADVEAEVAAPASTRELGISVMAAVDQSWTFDGTRWSGIAAGACASLGAWCFGARGRYATQDILVGQTAAARSDLSALATASYTKQLGRMQLIPELGLGLGRMTTSRIDGCRRPPTCDPQDTGCVEPQIDIDCAEHNPDHAYALDLNDHLHAATVTPRAAATMRLAVAITDNLYLDGIAAVTLAPFGHGQPYGLQPGTQMPVGIPAEELVLPGESIGTFELGLGLRWGSR
ncbi:MAG: hypothetical protein ABJE66_06340 [Deltaproteobacteria bacterium]